VSAASQKENSGLRVNYYLAQVDHPQREEQPPYQAECEDIIDALGLTPDEANIFKEIWRTANERTHGKAKEGNNPLRAAQKLVHYSGRILKKAQRLLGTDARATSAKAAVDALAGHEPEKKDEGWYAWEGKQPFPATWGNTYVEVQLRSSEIKAGYSLIFDWKQSSDGLCDDDIIAWRPARK
jgi:hypothetical protein